MVTIDMESTSKGEVEASLEFLHISSTLKSGYSANSGGNEVVQ